MQITANNSYLGLLPLQIHCNPSLMADELQHLSSSCTDYNTSPHSSLTHVILPSLLHTILI